MLSLGFDPRSWWVGESRWVLVVNAGSSNKACFGFNELFPERGNLDIGSKGSTSAKKGGGLNLADWTVLKGDYYYLCLRPDACVCRVLFKAVLGW